VSPPRTKHRIFALLAVLLTVVGACWAPSGRAAPPEVNPLAVPDMSSPRNTLGDFLATTDKIYEGWADLLTAYLTSGDLYLSGEHRRRVMEVMSRLPRALRVLDMSGVPPILKDTLGTERGLQFREILDRIPLPDLADIPDAAAMANQPNKRWRIPGTEIDFVQVQNGRRAGDYLLSPETVDRLPEYYERVKDLPYKPGAGRHLAEVYHNYVPQSRHTVYELFEGSPIGLSFFMPLRWLMEWPDWLRTLIGGAAVWQWIGIGLTVLFAIGLLTLCSWLGRRLADSPEDSRRHGWHALPMPLGVLFLAAAVSPAMCKILHIGNTPRIIADVLQTAAFYLSSAWLCLVISVIIGERIVGVEKLGIRSLDGQLIRLGTRLLGLIAAVGFLVRGADELGIPAYSVLAGLGVGGLAVALAAKDSLANLLGSMLIMFEKPFRIGHYIRMGSNEGTVESVGFRSTRIRTPDNSLLSIPNDTVVNTTVDNLTLRPKRRQRFTVGVTYDTPREKLAAFIEGIRAVILDTELADKDNVQVSLNNLSDSSLDILVIFHLLVTDYTSELRGRHQVLSGIMELAENMDVSFAFPTRTLVIEGQTAATPAARGDGGAIIPLRG